MASLCARPIRASCRPRRLLAATAALACGLAAGVGHADTHLGQQPDDHVVLSFWNFGSNGFCPTGGDGGETLFVERILPDASAVSFSIPEGKRLIVTDFNVKVATPKSMPRTATVNAALRIVNLAKGKGGHIVYNSDFHLVEDHDTVNLSLEGQSLAGISVGSKAALCPEVRLDDGTVGTHSLKVTSGNYRGYLIDDAPADDPGPTDGGSDLTASWIPTTVTAANDPAPTPR